MILTTPAMQQDLETLARGPALMTTCNSCQGLQEALNDVLSKAKSVRLVADTLNPEDGEISGPTQEIAHDIKVKCHKCQGSGWVPTEIGWRLLAFVKTFLDRAGALPKATEGEEIPF